MRSARHDTSFFPTIFFLLLLIPTRRWARMASGEREREREKEPTPHPKKNLSLPPLKSRSAPLSHYHDNHQKFFFWGGGGNGVEWRRIIYNISPPPPPGRLSRPLNFLFHCCWPDFLSVCLIRGLRFPEYYERQKKKLL